jgi:hypothetical protein
VCSILAGKRRKSAASLSRVGASTRDKTHLILLIVLAVSSCSGYLSKPINNHLAKLPVAELQVRWNLSVWRLDLVGWKDRVRLSPGGDEAIQCFPGSPPMDVAE